MKPTESQLMVPTLALNDGNQVPLVGFGTSRVLSAQSGDPGYEAIKSAIRYGYRFIDTAAYYLNEEAVGLAVCDCINEGVVKREDLFICTKLWCTAHQRASVMRACKESLARMALDYVDLYLIHWPMAYAEDADPISPRDPVTGKIRYSDTHYTETWRGMEDVKDAGLAKSIGLSNFNHDMTDNIFAIPCKHRPTVNQIECHPYLNQEKLLEYSNKNGIVLNAHCPLGSPGSCAKPGQPTVLEDPLVAELATKYSKSSAQILIRFLVQRNIPALPKSINPVRIRQNIEVFDFNLTKDDMDRLLALNRNVRYCANADEDVSDHPLYPFHLEY